MSWMPPQTPFDKQEEICVTLTTTQYNELPSKKKWIKTSFCVIELRWHAPSIKKAWKRYPTLPSTLGIRIVNARNIPIPAGMLFVNYYFSQSENVRALSRKNPNIT